MITDIIQGGKAAVVDWKILPVLGRLYTNPLKALAQLVENSADALQDPMLAEEARKGFKPTILVVIEKDSVSVIDNGHGMGLMAEDERRILEELKRGGEGSLDEEPRLRFSEASLKSLQWYLECVALSSKLHTGEEDLIRGILGIGGQAWRAIGDECRVLTRPIPSIAHAYPDWENLTAEEIPTLCLDHPSASSLASGSTEYAINTSPEPLADPRGTRLAHGTKIQISSLHGDKTVYLRPRAVGRFLQAEFGEDLRADRYHIWVVDCVGRGTSRAKAGVWRKIPPPKYPGRLIFDGELFFLNRRSFHATLYYDPQGRNLSPAIIHKGTSRCRLDEVGIPALAEAPFRGKITGSVEFPTFGQRDEGLWDAAKHHPLIGTVELDQWARRIQKLESTIREAIEGVDKDIRQERVRDLGRGLTDAVTEVLQGLGEKFEDIIGRPSTRQRGRKEGPKIERPRPRDLVTVTVLNQESRGVPGVVVTLWKENRSLQVNRTGAYGRLTFGRWPPGKYRVELAPDPNVTPAGLTVARFELTEDRPGRPILFHVLTDLAEPVPRRSRLPRVVFQLAGWGNMDEPWREMISTRGAVEINVLADSLREALEAENWDEVALLLSHYASAAIADSVWPGDAHTALQESSLLFPYIHKVLGSKG